MGFSVNSLGRLNIEVGYTVDKTGLNEIRNSLSDLMTKSKMFGPNLSSGMREAAASAKQLTGMLAAATDPKTGALNMGQLANSFKTTGTSLTSMRQSLSQAGFEGKQAFATLNKQILSTNTTFTKTEGIVGQLGKTFMNTFMYSFSYRIVGRFIQGISNAVSYVKDLDKSLTNIRIVTKESREEMERFAEKANDAAKNLGVSTKAYTDAALIFTQQGLKGKERDVKTETTMKVANVTGDDAAEVSQNLTAVWNGYKISSEQAEQAIDKLANVAAHSASNLAELSTGMSKVASAANTMGVSEDQLVAQLSTIESVTRQAPESIGTALKTIYARLGDLKVKGADEFGVSLGEVSSKLQTMGVDIIDQEGNMKEMGQVMEEVAEKWDGWTRAQKQAAAVAMAGKRQYPQLVALFENWDMYTENLDYSQNSEGEIEAQQQIYLDSIAGMQEKAKASWEEVYSHMFEGDMFKTVYESIAGIGDALAGIGDALPIGAIMLLITMFQSKLTPAVVNWSMGIDKASQSTNVLKMQQDAINNAYETTVSLGKQQVFTNQEILNATTQHGALLRSQVGASVTLSRENVALAESTQVRLALQEYMTETMQQQYQHYQQEQAAQDGLVSKEIMLYGERAGLLNLSKDQLILSKDNAIAVEEMANAYNMQVQPVANILEKIQLIFANNENNNAALKQTEGLLKGNGVQIDNEVVRLKNITVSEEQRVAILDAINKLMKDSNGSTQQMVGLIKEFVLDLEAASGNVRNIGTNLNWASSGMERIEQHAIQVKNLSMAYTGLTNTMFGISMTAMSLISTWRTLNSETSSTVEKTTAVIMGLGMVGLSIKQIVSGIQALRATIIVGSVSLKTLLGLQKSETAVLGAHEAALFALNKSEIDNIIIKGSKVGASKEQIMADIQELLVKKGIVAETDKETLKRLVNLGVIKLETKARLAYIATVIKEKIALLLAHPAILAVTAAIVGLALAYANSKTKAEEHAESLRQSQMAAHEASEGFKELKDTYENFKDSVSTLKDEKTALMNLTKGTEEWDEQILKINNHVTELLTQYPQLANGLTIDENDMFDFKEGALNKVKGGIQNGLQLRQKEIIQSQVDVKTDSIAEITDKMSDTVEKFEVKAAFWDEYSEEMSQIISDENVKDIDDLKGALLKQGIPFDKGQLTQLFAYLKEARDKDNEKIVLLRKAAGISSKNSTINFQGTGDTQKEIKENSDLKKTLYTEVYTQGLQEMSVKELKNLPGDYKSQYQARRLKESDYEDPNLLFDALGSTLEGQATRDALLGKKARSLADMVGHPRGDLASDKEKLEYFANTKMKEFLPSFMQDQKISLNGVDFGSMFNIVHLAAKQNNLEEGSLEWSEDDGGVVRKSDKQVVPGFKLTEEQAYAKVNKNFINTVFEKNLDKYLEKEYDISNIESKEASLAIAEISNYKNLKSIKHDYYDTEITDYETKKDTLTKKIDDILEKHDVTAADVEAHETGKRTYTGQASPGYSTTYGSTEVGTASVTVDVEKKNVLGKDKKEYDKALKELNELTKDEENITNLKNIQDAITKAQKGWEQTAINIYNSGNVSFEQSEKINSILQKYNLSSSKDDKKLGSQIEAAYQNLAENKGNITGFTNMLAEINWEDYKNDTDKVKQAFKTYKVKFSKEFVPAWETLVDEMIGITNETVDESGNLAKRKKQGQAYQKYFARLKPGDTLTDEQWAEATADVGNPELLKMMFVHLDGQKKWQWTAHDAGGQSDLGKTALKKAVIGDDIDQALTDAATIENYFGAKGKINITSKDYAKMAYDKKLSEENDTEYHQNVAKAATAFIKKVYASKDKKMIDAMENFGGVDNSKFTKAVNKDEIFDEEGNWINDQYYTYDDEYNNWLKSARGVQTGIKQGDFNPVAQGTYGQNLQDRKSGILGIYNVSNLLTAGTSDNENNELTPESKEGQVLQAIGEKSLAAAEGLEGSSTAMAGFHDVVKETNPDLDKHGELLSTLATNSSYLLMQGVKKMSSLFNDTYKDVKKGTPEFGQMLSDVAQAANDAFQTTDITPEFVKNHLDAFRKMGKGDINSLRLIQRELLKTKGLTHFGIKLDKGQTEQQLWSLVKKLQGANFKINANLNTEPLFQDLVKFLVKSRHMTNEQLSDWFSGINVALEWKEGVNPSDKAKIDKKGNLVGLKFSTVTTPNNLDYKGAAKSGEKDSSKGSGSNKPNYEFMTTDKNDIDHLHDLKQAMEDLSHSLQKLKTFQEGLFGQSLIDNLNKQNELIKEQNENLQKQYKIQTKDLGQSQTDMRKLYGFKFNKKGRIKNYKKILNERYNTYKDYVKKYNALTAKQQQGKKGASLKADIEKAKTIWTEGKDAVSKYDELYNARQENLNKMLENFNTIAENNIKKITAMSEALKSVNEVKQTALDIDKEMFHASNDYGYLSQYNLKSAKLAKQELAQQTKELNKTNKAIEKLKKKGFSKTYSSQMKSLIDTQNTLIKNVQTSMKKIKDSVLNNIELQSQAWKEYADNINKVIDQLQTIVKLTQTYSDVSKLIFGEDSYDKFKAYDEQQFIANLAILDAKNSELEAAEKREATARQVLEAAKKKNDAVTIEDAQKKYDEAVSNTNKLKEEVASAGKDAVETAINIYTYGIKQTIKELSDSLSSGYGWDVISNTMKLEKSYSDEWLDGAQKIGNITQLIAEFDQEIAKTANSSASAQQKILQCKQEQVANLEKIDKLTQYDIERARLKMSLTLKQIALEEARENKSKLRLKRDSQGNYSYQYGADLEAIKKAEQEEAAARLKINEEDQKELQRLMNQRVDLMKQYTDEEQKYWDKIRTAENKEEKQRFEQEWKDRQIYITNMLRHNEDSINRVQKTYLENDSALGYYNDIQGTKYTSTKQMTEKDYNQYREFLYGEEGLLPSYDSGFSAIELSTDEFVKQSKKALLKNQKDLKKLQDNFDKVGKTGDASFQAVIKGSDDAGGIVGATKAAQQASAATQNLTKEYVQLNTALTNSATSAINLYNTMTSSNAKDAVKNAANAANNAHKFKANTKAAIKYITKNAKSVITATNDMSTAAKDLKRQWNGVWKAAKKAAKAIRDAASASSGVDYTPTDYTTDNTKQDISQKVKVKKSKSGKYYAYKPDGSKIFGVSFNTKKEAKKYAKSYNKKYYSNKPVTIDKSDIHKFIKPKTAGPYTIGKNSQSRLQAFKWNKKKKKFENVKASNGQYMRILMIALNNKEILGVKGDKVKIAGGAYGGKPFGAHWYHKKTIQKYYAAYNKKGKYVGFDTGGYTGSWNNKNGKFALLHEKELVLNKKDTKNILKAVKLMRAMMTPAKESNSMQKHLNSMSYAAQSLHDNLTKYYSTKNNTNSTQQNINIKASFPNATNSSEIEKAFQQLSAKATQYAWSNKIK